MSLPCELARLNLSEKQDFTMSKYSQNCPPLIKEYLNTRFRSIYITDDSGKDFVDLYINITIGDQIDAQIFTIKGTIEKFFYWQSGTRYWVVGYGDPMYTEVIGSNVVFSKPNTVLFKYQGIVYQLLNFGTYDWALKIVGRQSYYRNGNVENYIGDIRTALSLLKINNNPLIDITSQLLIDESDIGHTIFNVVSKTNQTFIKDCPKIVNVLKGKGITMWDKLNYLYVAYPPGLLGYDFIAKIVRYSMLKYILGKLLYGVFDKKYILNKYFKQFLKDLGKSQYNNYVPFFTTGEYKDYYKYFLYDYHDNLKITM